MTEARLGFHLLPNFLHPQILYLPLLPISPNRNLLRLASYRLL
jgi:hypothetical protein